MATTRNFARDGVIDTISCGAGTDSLDADVIDLNLGGDCETISAAAAAQGADG
ncbi:MAG: hypothetical protein ACXWZM_03665 [Solirubrobacterales bacterium]